MVLCLYMHAGESSVCIAVRARKYWIRACHHAVHIACDNVI
jgi:hypothetical protein